ncbi:2OG-Fe(II) oxygenase [Pseudenhygromyxa sp. WMMC2535]|uniref:2OG-Fe(II) oxygenase n=1 Tax=Pseudenhygromyxa sp. WMMC2535 TaxID=2712867 RepID=UPI0015548572|nr:2OG-Fe(II) oxygenase [Pseudenhygromyxa sp. WMMC2535]NVB36479.1 2OG-Fe(II) oxygenase [Pseudenhygromyxa sp. WMMC2535]
MFAQTTVCGPSESPSAISVVENILDPCACRSLLESARADDHRTTIDAPVLALRLFYRLADELPEFLDGASLAGIKPQMQLHRMRSGEASLPHTDPAREQEELRSRLSLLVFLNGSESGLRGGDLIFPDGTRVAPRQGRAVLYFHEHAHADALVEAGERFILSGAVFYAPTWRPYL